MTTLAALVVPYLMPRTRDFAGGRLLPPDQMVHAAAINSRGSKLAPKLEATTVGRPEVRVRGQARPFNVDAPLSKAAPKPEPRNPHRPACTIDIEPCAQYARRYSFHPFYLCVVGWGRRRGEADRHKNSACKKLHGWPRCCSPRLVCHNMHSCMHVWRVVGPCHHQTATCKIHERHLYVSLASGSASRFDVVHHGFNRGACTAASKARKYGPH